MARVTLSPLVSDVRNKVAAIVFSKWRGVNYMRKLVTPSNPNTAAQQAVRTALKHLVLFWQSVAPVFRDAWNLYASGKPKSGFNCFVGSNVVNERDAVLWSFTKPNKDVTPIATMSIAAGGAGEIACTFTVTPVPVDHRYYYFAVAADSGTLLASGNWAAAVASPQTVGGLGNGTNVEFYVCDSLEIGGDWQLSEDKPDAGVSGP